MNKRIIVPIGWIILSSIVTYLAGGLIPTILYGLSVFVIVWIILWFVESIKKEL